MKIEKPSYPSRVASCFEKAWHSVITDFALITAFAIAIIVAATAAAGGFNGISTINVAHLGYGMCGIAGLCVIAVVVRPFFLYCEVRKKKCQVTDSTTNLV